MKLFYFALAMLGIALFVGCKKTTIVSGKVVSSANGSPLEGVTVTLQASRSIGPGHNVLSKDVALTDADGIYSVEVEGKNAEYIGLVMSKTGFVRSVGFQFDRGDCKKLDYSLHPYDAWLAVTFTNQSDDLTRNFHFVLTGAHFEGMRGCSLNGCGPYPTLPHESRTDISKIPGGADVDIIWNDGNIGSTAVPHLVTVFCPRNDTTYVSIDF